MRALGIIGGSGIYEMSGLTDVQERRVDTPFGPPSDVIVEATLDGTRLFFLPRHGRGHRVPPHAINYRANVCALKMLGAEQVVSLSAVGSMQEAISPGHVCIVDQYIDLTKRRIGTFFEDGVVGHVTFADPVCKHLASAAALAAEAAGGTVHRGGTYVCIEGPQFSTRAESFLYKSWGAAVIGMTAMPEAKLAREAELPYCTIAFSTDYDCWHETEDDVSVEAILAVLKQNSALAERIVRELCTRLPDPAESEASSALKYAVITPPDHVSIEARRRLDWLIGDGSGTRNEPSA